MMEAGKMQTGTKQETKIKDGNLVRAAVLRKSRRIMLLGKDPRMMMVAKDGRKMMRGKTGSRRLEPLPA